MSDKENIIVKCARNYEKNLKLRNYDYNEIERKLNEWIKNAIEYSRENPTLTEKELEDYLTQENIILK